MIKFIKNNIQLAEEHNVTTRTIATRIKNLTLEVHKVPKGMKYYQIDKEAIIADYIKSLTNK